MEENSGIIIEGEIKVSIIHCLSQDAAKDRANIRISFRQVHSFDKDKGIIQFFAFSSGEVKAGEEIKFRLYLLKSFSKIGEPIEATCTAANAATATDNFPKVAVSFDCKFDGSEQYDSIELIDSPHVSGFPHNKDYLNSFKVDDLISKGLLFDVSSFSFIPTLFNFDFCKFFKPETGSFQLTVPFHEKIKIPAWTQIEIPLAFPSGIILLATILSWGGANVVIEFSVDWKIDNQPLIWEQTVIVFNGIEFLVLPGMPTDPVQWDGYTPSPVSSDNYDPDNSNNNGSSDCNDSFSDNDESSENVSLDKVNKKKK